MRYALAFAATLGLLTSNSSARAQSQSDVAACRDITDSLIRLRCFDDVSKPLSARTTREPVVPSATRTIEPPNFAKFSVEPYRGPLGLPDFHGRDRDYAMYRTRIMAAAKSGPNFAGYLALVVIGCGAECAFVQTIDTRTGRVFGFPLGGEDNLSLDLKYRVNNRLLSARWVSNERCQQQEIVWTGTDYDRGKVHDLGTEDVCYQAAE